MAVTVNASRPLFQIEHDYVDKSVLLDIWEVTEFSGEPVGNEGQKIAWVSQSQLEDYRFPEANRDILSYLSSRK